MGVDSGGGRREWRQPVLAREKHMEGIVSQTNDEQYWDLWNRQKLSSELDLQRQNVLDQSQDLINQMIELEKHFNALELNLFGESTAVDMVSRALQHRSTSSRHIQSLHTVHSATISQLAAAQHLSELLSRQMALLNVRSPPAKQESLKKQLFESIGISDPVDYTGFTSTRKAVEPSSNRNRSVSSSGAALKESRWNVSSSLGSHDPETARRRRDSLDKNWANFEAPRTTVKRMLVAEKGHNISSSFSSRDNQLASPFKREDSISPHTKFLTMQDSNGRKDIASKVNSETVATSMFKWAGTISETSQAEAENSFRLQVVQGNNFSAAGNKSIMSSSLSSLSFSASLGNPNVKDDGNKMGAQTGHMDKSKPAFIEESKPSGRQLLQEKSSDLRMQPHLLSSPAKGGDIPVSYREGFPLTAAVGGKSPLMGSARDVQFSPASGFSSISTSSRSASVVAAPNTQSSTTSIGDGLVSSAKLVKDDSNQVIQRPPSASSVSSFEAHVKSKDSKTVEIPPMGPFISSATEPLKAGLKPSTEEIGAETNLASTPRPSQKIEHSAGDGLKFEFSTSSTPASEVPKQEASGSPLAVSRTATLASDMTHNTKSEKASVEYKTPSLSLLDSGFISGGKNVADAPVSHEEEMEEEAPETNETATLSLGSLAGFGIGSSPSVTTSRSNPFGAPVTSTPVSLSVPSGELFRPASFSFQSLQPSQQSQPPTSGAAGRAFGSGSFLQQPPSGSGFGQPGQIGSGQRPLGSVLGSFGQSRQLGAGLPSGGFGQPGQIGSGQQALGSVLGSFGQSRQLGTGFGAFSKQGTGGFGGLGTGAGGGGKPASDLFTQMRK
ncbi:hypothetical protein Cgig2_023950 [Carnegiea gigantea]|uniref:Nuclear pore complex protein n=1 Tax=Carnegiea gigantea TaxID=171969 RepID=A0A9Q1KC13_9CARY|nr:hypothetical protein Cgig2_023950 [Carnegiea gigantea]